MAHSRLKVDMVGKRFGRLKVISEIPERNKNGHIMYECACDCGNIKQILGSSMRQGLTRSCGCLQNEFVTIHGMDGTPIYKAWTGMKSRCYNPKNSRYNRYGARGIKVCDRWLNSFENFYADMGDKPAGTSIDRMDNDGDYEPGNCRWATPREQALNRRDTVKVKYKGEIMYIYEYAEKIGLSESGARKKAVREFERIGGVFIKNGD